MKSKENHGTPSSATSTQQMWQMDPANYVISFEGMYDNEECSAVFEKYLENTHNLEQLLFLRRVEGYVLKKSSANRYNEAKDILKLFVSPNSKHEINLGVERQHLIDQFKECSEESCPKSLFESLHLQVFAQLKEDCFPKFVASELFKRFFSEKIANEGEAYFNSIAVKKQKGEVDDDKTDTSSESSELGTDDIVQMTDTGAMDLSHPLIHECNFEYFKRQIDERSHWKQIKTKSKFEGREIFISKESYALTDRSGGKPRKLKKYKEVGILPYSIDEVFYAMIDYPCIFYAETAMKSMEQVGYHPISPQNKYASTVYHLKFGLPFPVQNRDFVMAVSARRESNGAISIVRKSAPHDGVGQKTKGYLRAEYVGGVYLESIYRDVTRYTVTALIDMHGWLPISMWNMLLAQRDDSIHQGYIKGCEERRKKYGTLAGSTPPTNSCGIYDTFSDLEKSNRL